MLHTGLRDIEVVRIDVGDTKPHSGVMMLFVHGKGPSEKDDFVVLTEALQKNRGRGIYAPIPTNGETLNTLVESVKLLMRVRTNITEQRGCSVSYALTLLSVYEPETRHRIEDWCEASHKPGTGASYNALLTVKPSHVIRATVGLGFGRGRLRYARLIPNGRDLETRETSVVKRGENFERFDAALDKVLDLNDWHAFIDALGEAGYANKGMVSSENTIPLTYAITLIAKHRFGVIGVELQRVAKRWFFMALLTQMYTGNFESVFEQQMNSIDEFKNADAFHAWIDTEIAARLTDDYFDVTLPNELDKNRASGPVCKSKAVCGGRGISSLIVLRSPESAFNPF